MERIGTDALHFSCTAPWLSQRESQGVRFIVSLRLGDGELCIAGEKDVICLVKINGLLKALIQNVYPASVLHYDTGYGTVEAEEIRIGLFSRVCCQGNALAAKLHGGDRERFQPIGSVLAPAGAGFQGDGFGQQLNLPIKSLPRKRHILAKIFSEQEKAARRGGFLLAAKLRLLYYGTSRKASHGGAYQFLGFKSPT